MKFFQEKLIKYVSGATLLGGAVLLFVIATPLSASANTVYTSGYGVSDITLNQTGSCCSGLDNYKFYSQTYADIPAGTSFDKLQFSASTTISSKNVYVVIVNDNNDLVSTMPDGYSNDDSHRSGDTIENLIGYKTAYKEGNVFTLDLEETVTLESGQYLNLVFSDSTSGFASTTFVTSPGLGMYRNVQGNNPTFYEYRNDERIKIELCSGDCGTFGEYGSLSGLGFFTLYNTRFLSLDVTGTSSVFTFDIDYYLDPNEYDTSDSAYNPTLVNVAVVSPSATTPSTYGFALPTGTGTSSVSVERDLSPLEDGTYTVRVSFGNSGCSIGLSACPFPSAYIYYDFFVNGGVVTGSSTPSFYNALESAGSINSPVPTQFFSALANYFLNIIENKHPFAWVTQSLTYFAENALIPQSEKDLTWNFDLAYIVTSATSTEGYLDFTSLQGSGIDTTVSVNPITTGCDFLTFDSFDSCSTFRDLTKFSLYFICIYFIGVLLYKLIKPEND